MENQRRNFEQKLKEHQRKKRRETALAVLLAVVVVCGAASLIVQTVSSDQRADSAAEKTVSQNVSQNEWEETQTLLTETESETEKNEGAEKVLQDAALLAAMYDYDGAVSCLRNSVYYETDPDLQNASAAYEAQKAACVAWEPENVTHIFYHTIIVDPSRAFDGEADQDGFNQYMVTMDEFSAIMQTMYEEGYVMVSMHDMCTLNADGTMSEKSILLPEGKIPFVLSQDDVSYYHYMEGDGFAEKLIIDENGKIKNTYIEEDGTVSVGDYDMVPWIDTFVEEHPDFSYHGRKGIIALTGYEGVLGYRTDEVYRTREADRLTEWQINFFNENPDFDEAAWQKEVDDATAVAAAMKEEGWEFASHTWGHIDPQAIGLEKMETDTQRWLDNVEPIVGATDVIIFAFGADIGDWQPYSDENAFYVYLKEKGFRIFCNVDSSPYWVQFNGESMRMARRNIDGYRMYYNPDLLTDLFDVSDVWDDSRPVPVPAI